MSPVRVSYRLAKRRANEQARYNDRGGMQEERSQTRCLVRAISVSCPPSLPLSPRTVLRPAFRSLRNCMKRRAMQEQQAMDEHVCCVRACCPYPAFSPHRRRCLLPSAASFLRVWLLPLPGRYPDFIAPCSPAPCSTTQAMSHRAGRTSAIDAVRTTLYASVRRR